jgi:hypothetical protein
VAASKSKFSCTALQVIGNRLLGKSEMTKVKTVSAASDEL